MSIATCRNVETGPECPMPLGRQSSGHPLHQLAVVRQRQGVSRRAIARRLKTDVGLVKRQEQADSDMLLSTLYKWQQALGVPVSEQLGDDNEPLTAPVMRRAQLDRLMKTAMAIQKWTQQPGIQRMAQVLVDQLIEIMPELSEVTPWHAVGKRRSQDELGRAAERTLGLDFLHDSPD